MNQRLLSIQDAIARIESGAPLLLAGDEAALRQLPAGNWVAGTIPYFMTAEGGLSTRDRVFVTEVPDEAIATSISVYDEPALPRVYSELPAHGFGIIIVPAGSRAHLAFATGAPSYDGFAMTPLAGWVAGVDLKDIGAVTPKVFDGRTGEAHEQAAVVMAITLPPNRAAEVGIVNLFSQGGGDALVFPETGFSATEVLVNGVPTNLADYVTARQWDTRWPLVADYHGAMINVSFQAVDTAAKQVQFYAPVFSGMVYRHANPVEHYARAFGEQVYGSNGHRVVFSCNCILNYVHSNLEGKRTGPFVGPVTFGEVAYQLLNQTMVFVSIADVG